MLAPLLALALAPFNFYTHGPYDGDVPKPESVLGYQIGDHITTYAQQQSVIKAIAGHAKARVRYMAYGNSNEGRELRVLAITSPKNMERIEFIAQGVGSLTAGTPNQEIERDT